MSRRPGPLHMTISPSHRFVWYRVAKVGTRSILGMLDAAGVEHFDSDLRARSMWLYRLGRYRGYYAFAFVRNPWDRLVSSWADKVVDTNLFGFDAAALAEFRSSFGAFVRWVASVEDIDRANRHIRPMSALIDLAAVDFVGRMESFGDDIRAVASRLDIDVAAVAHRNASQRSDYRSYYDDETRGIVADVYARDIDGFGYSF